MWLAALTLLAIAGTAWLLHDASRDARKRRADARRRVVDQDAWQNPIFTEAGRPFRGVPLDRTTTQGDHSCLPPRVTT
jgi:cbb3-type cytochrome oxidase subunit 3